MKSTMRLVVRQWLLVLFGFMGLMLGCQQAPVAPDASPSPTAQVAMQVSVQETEDLVCVEGVQSSGALFKLCVPRNNWNGDLFVWAHGYESPLKPIALPEDDELVAMVTGLGYAYATTSYSKTGLAIKQGVQDVTEVVQLFKDYFPEPVDVFLVGGSEGGAVTTLAVERHPDVFSGGLAMCGPVGDFARQINYFGDFRVVFDYFFPGVLPGSAVDIPMEVMLNFDTKYVPRILEAIHADPNKTQQLLRVTRAPYDPTDPATIDETVVSVLWFNVFSTNDGRQTLGGQPFDNMTRRYRGSDDDRALNAGVQRFAADPQALAEIERYYQTSGDLQRHIVAIHTVGDPVVPYWHQPMYRQKVRQAGKSHYYDAAPILRYGHCTFEPEEVLAAFALLVARVKGESLAHVDTVLPTPATRENYQRFSRTLRQSVQMVGHFSGVNH